MPTVTLSYQVLQKEQFYQIYEFVKKYTVHIQTNELSILW